MVGQRIRDAREACGYSIALAAQYAGMDVTNYSRIERGDANPTLHSLIKIAHALDTDAGHFTTGLTPSALPVKDRKGARFKAFDQTED